MTIYLFSFLTSLGEYSYFMSLTELLIWPSGRPLPWHQHFYGASSKSEPKTFHGKVNHILFFTVLIMCVCVCAYVWTCMYPYPIHLLYP